MTTPNTDFNVHHPIPNGNQFRDPDHKFELSSSEFKLLCSCLVEVFYNYAVFHTGCGFSKAKDWCTQVAVFVRKDCIDRKFSSNPKVSHKAFINMAEEMKDFVQKSKAKTLVLDCPLKNGTPLPDIVKDILGDLVKSQTGNVLCKNRQRIVKDIKCSKDDSLLYPEITKRYSTFYDENLKPFYTVKYFNAKTLYSHCIQRHVKDLIWCVNPLNSKYPFKNVVYKPDKLIWDFKPWFESESKNNNAMKEPEMIKPRPFKELDETSRKKIQEEEENAIRIKFKKLKQDDIEMITTGMVSTSSVFRGSRYLAMSVRLIANYMSFADELELR